jgi:hypothetical protein
MDENEIRALIEVMVQAEWGPGKETVVLLTDGSGTPMPKPKMFCFVPDGMKRISAP